MKIKVDFNKNELPKKYSKYANKKEMLNGNPIVSFPFKIVDIPTEAKYLSFTLIDYDAIPVCGFSWIHWTVANIDASFSNIPENYSQDDKYKKTQGTNSFASVLVNESNPKIIHRYVGPTPPDKDHNYTLTVYALNDVIDIDEGFYLNDLYSKMEEKIIEQASINIIGKN